MRVTVNEVSASGHTLATRLGRTEVGREAKRSRWHSRARPDRPHGQRHDARERRHPDNQGTSTRDLRDEV